MAGGTDVFLVDLVIVALILYTLVSFLLPVSFAKTPSPLVSPFSFFTCTEAPVESRLCPLWRASFSCRLSSFAIMYSRMPRSCALIRRMVRITAITSNAWSKTLKSQYSLSLVVYRVCSRSPEGSTGCPSEADDGAAGAGIGCGTGRGVSVRGAVGSVSRTSEGGFTTSCTVPGVATVGLCTVSTEGCLGDRRSGAWDSCTFVSIVAGASVSNTTSVAYHVLNFAASQQWDRKSYALPTRALTRLRVLRPRLIRSHIWSRSRLSCDVAIARSV